MNAPIRPLLALTALTLAAAALPAQWSTLAAGAENHRTQRANQRCLAFSAHRFSGSGSPTTWSLVRRPDAARLLLKRSQDGGATWDPTSWLLPGTNHAAGAIVMGPDCRTLHVAYSARNSGSWYSAYYRAFDTETASWLPGGGALGIGTSSGDQYVVDDIDVTTKGRVVVAYSSRNAPVQPWFNGSWASILRVAPPPAPGTAAVFPNMGYPINVGYTGPVPNIQTVGETVHVAYRSAAGGYGIFYRGFDTNTLTWNQTIDVPIGAAQASNMCSIAATSDCWRCGIGRLYVLFTTETSSGDGQLMITSAATSNPTVWSTPELVAVDAPIVNGNVSYHHYTLAAGENGSMFAYYAPLVENHRNLYSREYVNGVATGPATLVASSAIDDRFAFVNGYRGTAVTSDAFVTVSGASATSTYTDVRFYRRSNSARTVGYGRYLGPNTESPRLSTANAPKLGSGTLMVTVCNVPPPSMGFLLVGIDCTPETPLPPLVFGPGCFKLHDWFFGLAYTSQQCPTPGVGYAEIPLSLPSPDPALVGEVLYLQAAHSFGSPLPLVTSNAAAAVLDL